MHRIFKTTPFYKFNVKFLTSRISCFGQVFQCTTTNLSSYAEAQLSKDLSFVKDVLKFDQIYQKFNVRDSHFLALSFLKDELKFDQICRKFNARNLHVLALLFKYSYRTTKSLRLKSSYQILKGYWKRIRYSITRVKVNFARKH